MHCESDVELDATLVLAPVLQSVEGAALASEPEKEEQREATPPAPQTTRSRTRFPCTLSKLGCTVTFAHASDLHKSSAVYKAHHACRCGRKDCENPHTQCGADLTKTFLKLVARRSNILHAGRGLFCNETDGMPYRKQTLGLYCDRIYTNHEWDVECAGKYSHWGVPVCSKPVCVGATCWRNLCKAALQYRERECQGLGASQAKQMRQQKLVVAIAAGHTPWVDPRSVLRFTNSLIAPGASNEYDGAGRSKADRQWNVNIEDDASFALCGRKDPYGNRIDRVEYGDELYNPYVIESR